MLAVLDANVLYPFQLRNLLLHLAAEEAFEPLWSDRILEEARRNLRGKAGQSALQWERLTRHMRRGFPGAWGHGFEAMESEYVLPDEDDRHVLALAVYYEADVIVTWNTKDFPVKTLASYGLERLRPPTFLDHLWRKMPDVVLRAAENHRTSLTKSRLSRAQYLSSLREYARLKQFANRLEASGFLNE